MSKLWFECELCVDRCVPSQFGVKMRAYSCPENLFNYSDDTPKAAAPITGGTNHIPSDTAADYIHCESLITSSNSTANHVWFSNPEIEQEEEYAKRQSIKQSLNVLSTLRYEEVRFSHTVFLRTEVAPEYRPPPIRSRIKPENFILKAIAYRISSNTGREITTENVTSRGLYSKKYGSCLDTRRNGQLTKTLNFCQRKCNQKFDFYQ